MFTPWRDEARDIDSFWPYEEKCRELSEQFNCQLQEFSPYRSEIDEALANIRENEENDNVCDQVPRDSPERTDNELASDGENYTMIVLKI